MASLTSKNASAVPSGTAGPTLRVVIRNALFCAADAGCKLKVTPQVLSVVVVIHNDIGTTAPPGEKLAVFVPRQSLVLEKNVVSAASAGKANPNVVSAIAASAREVFIKFIFFPLCVLIWSRRFPQITDDASALIKPLKISLPPREQCDNYSISFSSRAVNNNILQLFPIMEHYIYFYHPAFAVVRAWFISMCGFSHFVRRCSAALHHLLLCRT